MARLRELPPDFATGHPVRYNLFHSKRFDIFRESPGTAFLASAWVLVYLLMVGGQWQGWLPKPEAAMFEDVGPLGIGAVSQQTGQMFGAWNSAEILCGQLWRTVLATFIHFGLIHIALNMFGLLQLGQLIEEWYGARLLFGIVILLGFLGNGMAALARPLFGEPHPQVLLITSGGGSTVIFGLIGLIAVVGRRSRSRMGNYLYKQMIGLLAFNFMIGLTIPQIDNYAHAGGAVAGALIGRLHYLLIGWHENRPRLCKAIALMGLITLIGGVAGQLWVHRVQGRMGREAAKIQRLDQFKNALGEVQSRFITRSALGLRAFQTIQPRGRLKSAWTLPLYLPIPDEVMMNNTTELGRAIDRADELARGLGSPQINSVWKPVRAKARMAITRPPLSQEIPDLIAGMEPIAQAIVAEARQVNQREVAIAKELVLWQTPWPNVVWTEIGPALKTEQKPRGRPIPVP